MTTYLIVGLDRPEIKVQAFKNAEAASPLERAAAEEGTPAWVASSAVDLVGRPGPILVRLYNAIAPEGVAPVKKFETRTSGAERLFALLEKNYGPKGAAPAAAPEEKPKHAEEVEVVKAKGKPKKAKAERKDRAYKAKVVSKGSEKAKESALELIQRARGATAQEIAEKLEVSLGTAKNLVWYLRRDGKKITVDRSSDRKPYVIA